MPLSMRNPSINAGYIDAAKTLTEAKVILGGNYDKSIGILHTANCDQCEQPDYAVTMREELFGPVLSVYIYKDQEYARVLELVDNTSDYALTGAIFAEETAMLLLMALKLKHAAGNFYINDKPTDAVVDQQIHWWGNGLRHQ
ncbi:MAG: aldehyde dehydrogenase family protein [Saprospiraceae bacterium]